MNDIDETILIDKGLPKTWTCPHCGKRNRMGSYKEEELQGLLEGEDMSDLIDRQETMPDKSKYEYHYDHTDCIWYRPEAKNRCPVTCAQYRDGWNDAMNYIFRDGKGYRPFKRGMHYE